MSALPKGWASATIGEVTTYVQRGRSPKYIESSALPVINQKCVRWSGVDETYLKFVDPSSWSQWSEERFLKPGDILWNSTGTGTIGRAALFDTLATAARSVADSHVTIVRSHPEFVSDYLFKFIRSDAVQSRIDELQNGSTNQVELDRQSVLGTRLPVAPSAEQRRIVAKIDCLSARSKQAREDLRRVPALVLRFKDRLLELAFSGALTAEWRRARRMQDWSITTLSTLVSDGPSNGWSPQSGDDATGALTLKLTATTSGRMRLDEKATKRIYETPEPTSKFWLCPGDILIQRANTIEYVGTAAIYDGPPHTYIYPDLMMRIRLKDASATRFIWRYLNAASTKDYFRSKATGTAGNMPKINGDTVRNLPVPLMDPAERNEIVRRIEHAFAVIERLAAEAISAQKLLNLLDQTVLAKAFRGELVPQDTNDEPASVLIERIRAERAAAPAPKRGRKPKSIKV